MIGRRRHAGARDLSVDSRGSARRMPRVFWNATNDRIFYPATEQTGPFEENTSLYSVRPDGTDGYRVLQFTYAEEVVPSPDGRWAACKALHDGYVAAVPERGASPLDVSDEETARHRGQVGYQGGGRLAGVDRRQHRHVGQRSQLLPPDSRQGLREAPQGRRKEGRGREGRLHEAAEKKEDKKDEKKPDPNPPQEIEIHLTVPRAKPTGTLVLDGARLITMHGDEVIENGRLVIDDNRIQAVGRRDAVTIPPGANVVDVTGSTIMPGIVDVHAHLRYGVMDIFPEQEWRYTCNLAYGVTTTHDPSASTHLAFGQGEMVEAGVMKGPRIYSTGYILYGADQPGKAPTNSKEDAEHHVRRMKKLGAFSIKSYMQPRREQRQWFIEAARAESMLVFPEGGGNFEMNMSMIVDGHSGIEHAIPVTPLYDDVIQMWSRSKSGWTPTLLVAYGGLSGEHWFYQHADPPAWQDQKLLRFTPRGIVDGRSRRLPVYAYDGDWNHIEVSKATKKLLDAGGQRAAGRARPAAGAGRALGALGAGARRHDQHAGPALRHPDRRLVHRHGGRAGLAGGRQTGRLPGDGQEPAG